jgi:competence protein ComEC
VVVAYYAAWAAWLAAPGRLVIRRSALSLAALAAALMLAAPPAPRAWWTPGPLRVTFLDVAQGDATLVQFPGGGSLLVDAGGSHEGRFDIGGRVVAPALWSLGVRRLDYLAITHPDPDHAGGAVAVVRDFRPRAIWEGVPVPRDELRRQLEVDSRRRGLEWREVRAGDRMRVGEVEIVAVHPPPPDWERQDTRNDDSLVLDVRYGEVSILLTGDIGLEVERRLEAALLPAALRVVKAPHHGSATSSSPDLIATARPALAIVSAGKGNMFGHPAPSVLERYRAAGVPVLRTDLEGAITVETDGRTVEVRTWSGRRMSLGR